MIHPVSEGSQVAKGNVFEQSFDPRAWDLQQQMVGWIGALTWNIPRSANVKRVSTYWFTSVWFQCCNIREMPGAKVDVRMERHG